MKHTRLFATLLCSTYDASGTMEPIERYYASMFGSYFEQADSQPCCTAVKAIARGDRAVPRKLLHHYRDPEQPRCPQKLVEDLAALAECCFADAARREALHQVLETFLQTIPAADTEDLRLMMKTKDLMQMWACLALYALCGDYYGAASY